MSTQFDRLTRNSFVYVENKSEALYLDYGSSMFVGNLKRCVAGRAAVCRGFSLWVQSVASEVVYQPLHPGTCVSVHEERVEVQSTSQSWKRPCRRPSDSASMHLEWTTLTTLWLIRTQLASDDSNCCTQHSETQIIADLGVLGLDA